KERRVSGLLGSRVFARGLTELFRGFCYVEDIIRDLERQTDGAAEVAQALNLGMRAARVDSAANQARRNQSAGLGALNVLECFRVGWLALRFQILYLAADHAVDSTGPARDLLDDADLGFCRALQARQHLVGLCLQSIAGENGDGFAKDHVTG